MATKIEHHPDNFVTVEFKDYQKLKRVEDKVLDALLCLHSTSNTLSTFSTMYNHLFSGTASSSDTEVDTIALTISAKQREVDCIQKRAESLLSKTRNTRTIVRDWNGISY